MSNVEQEGSFRDVEAMQAEYEAKSKALQASMDDGERLWVSGRFAYGYRPE